MVLEIPARSLSDIYKNQMIFEVRESAYASFEGRAMLIIPNRT